MIPEIGHFALVLALCLAVIQGTVPLIGAQKKISSWVEVAAPAAIGQTIFIVISFICLTYAFLTDDFSVGYTARQSNTELPVIYKISSVWGGHEGSLLLWTMFLAMWTAAVALFSRAMPLIMRGRVIAIMGLVSVGFLLFTLLTSNPFDRMFPAALEGRSLNPLLQDFGLIIHPPMLYMGYVGFSVAFAFAIAAMLGGRLDSAWAKWSRPWTNIAWVFLTIGIALGSWWAYYELGWGGWWFWDPVENASFMPWLVGTALIHSLAATEKRGVFKAWTVLLAIFAFSLSLLGTFLVRSGVLTSVHAFANDPERGIFILIFLAVVVGGSLALYTYRAPQIRSAVKLNMMSREGGLLINNILLVVTAFSILLGTLYPLALDALDAGKISVGPPYFNALFVPLTIPIALLLGVAALARWKQDSLERMGKKLLIPFVVSVVLGAAIPYSLIDDVKWGAVVAIMLAVWITMTSAQGIVDRVSGKQNKLQALLNTPRGFYGQTFAHMGVAMFVVGITLTTLYSTEKDIRLVKGQSYSIGEYEFLFEGVQNAVGPNYKAAEGWFTTFYQGKEIGRLHSQKRLYNAGGMPMTEAGIDPGFWRDLYVSLGEDLDGKGAWSVRLYHKPFIRWIWLGSLIMAFGGLLAATDKRYRKALKTSEVQSNNTVTV
ncbi:MAG: c-type cytochrome biogenesis protein CcmF [endosymbiont of Galathealinum brachiosum]|uniref:C-type cytochrome biogenesis protein CcmF n=1 Tax=endosymbiont of Galathealinum brachiosum TaxID=2200906 RepID=A0A370DA02_9GAMM|nr:MAG: c-type cytochrome biogenesis protein CcmF [endosymbiont of Galathealinum brachiosum]